ncbi:MAG: alanyl-tRNA editing protein [Treponema sp.]|jgi:alanyl-tRNA synthetase|nr:alanyl-tRNA editing protein [Treponema sp.]
METIRKYYDVDMDGGGCYEARILDLRPPVKTGEKSSLDDPAAGAFGVILDRTVFYPEGGGQPGDRGRINGAGVLDVREKDGEILHMVSAGEAGKLERGRAEIILDLVRRRDFTVQHSAQHLLSAAILRITSCPTVSMHLGTKYNTIDVDGKDIDPRTLRLVEDETAAVIEKNLPVLIHLCPPERLEDFPLRKKPPRGEDMIRVVEIKGTDFSPCCGTHLASTGGIGMLFILGAEKYKGMTRISFIAGRRCLRETQVLRENAQIISRALKVPVEETGGAVRAYLEKAADLEEQIKACREEAARMQARGIVQEAGLEGAASSVWYARYFPGADAEEVIRLGRHLRELSGAVFVLGAGKDGKFAALCSAGETDIRPRIREALEKAGGRGGGGNGFFQGQFASAGELESFIGEFQNRPE